MQNSKLRIYLRRHKNILFAYVIMTIMLFLFAFSQKDFLTKYGPQSIFNQVITLCLAAFGQTIIIITSGVDLSIGFLIIFLNCVAATIMQPCIDFAGSNLWGCIICAVIVLVLGLISGFANGAIVVYGRLQPIVATLATGSIFYGLSRYVRPSPGGKVIADFARAMTGRVFDIIPTAAVVLLIVILFLWIPYRKSRSGQALYAIGGNEYAAYVSGININKAKLLAYSLAGVSYAICALMLTAQTRSGDPTANNNFCNNTIAAAVLGGASLQGGKGSYWGSIAGAFLLSLIVGLLIFWKISSYYQNLIQGLILILALSTDLITEMIRNKKKRNNAHAMAKQLEV